MKTSTLLLFFFFSIGSLNGQSTFTPGQHYCAPLSAPNFNSENGINFNHLEELYKNHLNNPENNLLPDYTLPVVVHVIHNNGSENISDAEIEQGIENINQALLNTGYYNPDIGYETPFQLCLAARDPDNNPTNGVTRTISTFTDLTIETQELEMKNLSRWDPTRYINIWLVKEMASTSAGSAVVGYAYFPDMHGSDLDGIVGEADLFGSTPAYSTVFVHELGHYLGLYHTFQDACFNDDCLLNGDRVCDTPPDQSTAPVPCSSAVNTCNTDVNPTDSNNPFSIDQNDMIWNYMDYGDPDCFAGLTAGQSTRMEFFLTEVRYSLLDSYSCFEPCPTPVNALFTASETNIEAGTTVSFSNGSTNAMEYEWMINGVLFSSLENTSYTFNTQGIYSISLVGTNDGLCYPDIFELTIDVSCPVTALAVASETEVEVGDIVSFSSTIEMGTGQEWFIDGVLANTNASWDMPFDEPGNFEIALVASNGICLDTSLLYIRVFPFCTLGNQPSYVEYLESSGSGQLKSMAATSDGGFVAMSNRDVLRLDSELSIIWSKKYSPSNSTFFSEIAVTQDNGFVIAGEDFNDDIGFMLKLDEVGEMEWMYEIDTTFEMRFLDIDINGDIVATGKYKSYSEDSGDICLLKFDAETGNLMWLKKLDAPIEDIRTRDIVATPDGIVISGFSYGGIVVIKTDHDGNLLWSKNLNYDDNAMSDPVQGLFVDENGHIFATGNTTYQDDNYFQQVGIIVELDPSGNLVQNKLLLYEEFMFVAPFATTINKAQDGNFLVTFTQLQTVVKLDPDFNIIWTRKYPLGQGGFNTALPLPDGSFYMTTRIISPNWFIQRVSETDSLGDCGYETVNFYAFDDNPIVEDLELIVTSSTNISPRTVSSSNLNVTKNLICTVPDVGAMDAEIKRMEVSDCGNMRQVELEIFNEGTNVITADVPIAFYDKNPTQDPTSTLISQSLMGTTIQVGATQTLLFEIPMTATSTVFAVLNDDASLSPVFDLNNDFPVTSFQECEFYDNIDSAMVSPYLSSTLNLGPDTSLCFESAIVLTATGGAIYEWQDGSNDSVYIVSTPGVYWVERTDICGNVNLDTVIVENFIAPVLDLGSDILTCENGITVLSANANYATYHWQDNSTLPNFSAFSEGTYWLEVTDVCGLSQSDTINVDVDPVSIINLGVDTFLCPGEVLNIQISGFDSYQWMPEAGIDCATCGTVVIDPEMNTTYFLVAQTDEGCITTDTIQITRLTEEQCTTATTDLDENTFKFEILPNPTSGKIDIILNLDQSKEVEVAVYNLMGQKLLSNQIVAKESIRDFDLEKLSSGVYFIELTIGDEHQYLEKVLVLK